jgi:alkyl sulfatase BDS1-like metallo-beta-lactamase superfamily hydrolase
VVRRWEVWGHEHLDRSLSLSTGISVLSGTYQARAAEQVYMPRHQRGDWENYGQVESHVRQVFNGTMGWFGGDVYDINPLSGNEEAARTVQLMGGPVAVQEAAAGANQASEHYSRGKRTLVGWTHPLRYAPRV